MTNVNYSNQKNTSSNTHTSEIAWKKMQAWMCYDSTQITLCLRHTIHSCSFFPFPLHSLPRRGNGSCMQVISVFSDGRSALIGWLNSCTDVKIAGCVCQKATLLVVVTSWRHCHKWQLCWLHSQQFKSFNLSAWCILLHLRTNHKQDAGHIFKLQVHCNHIIIT